MELTEKQSKQRMEIRRILQAALKAFGELEKRQREMLMLRYGLDNTWAWQTRTLEEAARKHGSNPESVRLAEQKLIKLMLTYL